MKTLNRAGCGAVGLTVLWGMLLLAACRPPRPVPTPTGSATPSPSALPTLTATATLLPITPTTTYDPYPAGHPTALPPATLLTRTPGPLRYTWDNPDDVTGHQIHVMYVLPSDGMDRTLDLSGVLADSVAVWNGWLRDQTGGRGLRLDTYQGALDVTFFWLDRTDEDMMSLGVYVRDEIERQIRQSEFDDPQKLYAVYYEGRSTWACGGGAWPPTLPGSVAAMYLHGLPDGLIPCDQNPFAQRGDPPGYMEFAMLHELLHTMGLVAECAPTHTRAGHTSDDPTDLMYAGDADWHPSQLDVGRDDYYDHSNDGCLDLADSLYLEP